MGSYSSDQKNARFFGLKLSRTTDAEIIQHLEAQESIQGYIRNLIRNDMMKGEKKMWYAVQMNREDDWSTGSYDREEAIRMAKEQLAEYPETLIAVIDNSTSNPVCVDEITDFE